MSPMPEYSDEDLTPTETKSVLNGLLNNSKISDIIEENGDKQENGKVSTVICDEKIPDNQLGNLNTEIGVEITESDNISEVNI